MMSRLAGGVLATATSESVYRGVRRTSNVSRGRERSNCVDNIIFLTDVANLKLCCLQIKLKLCDLLVFCVRFHLIQSVENLLRVSSRVHRDLVRVLCALEFHAVDVAVGFTESLLGCESVFQKSGVKLEACLHDVALRVVESLKHRRILCVEAITETVLDTADAVVNLLCVEAVGNFVAGHCAVGERRRRTITAVIAPVATAPEKGKDNDNPDPVACESVAIAVATVDVHDGLNAVHCHNNHLVYFFFEPDCALVRVSNRIERRIEPSARPSCPFDGQGCGMHL